MPNLRPDLLATTTTATAANAPACLNAGAGNLGGLRLRRAVRLLDAKACLSMARRDSLAAWACNPSREILQGLDVRLRFVWGFLSLSRQLILFHLTSARACRALRGSIERANTRLSGKATLVRNVGKPGPKREFGPNETAFDTFEWFPLRVKRTAGKARIVVCLNEWKQTDRHGKGLRPSREKVRVMRREGKGQVKGSKVLLRRRSREDEMGASLELRREQEVE